MGSSVRLLSFKLISLIIGYVIAMALIHYLISCQWILKFYPVLIEYRVYFDLILTAIFGYAIISYFSSTVYWVLKPKYGHSTASTIRSLVKVLGVGFLASLIAGMFSSPSMGVALGGFIGMVIGFATQRVLGQVVAGILILILRPFSVGDVIETSGVKGEVVDVNSLFVVLKRDDNAIVLVPCSTVIGAKIVKYPSKGD